MGHKRMPGLTLRNGIWHINKKINDKRLYESTGTGSLKAAEKYLVHRLETIREASIYGVRPKRVFREAATRYLLEKQHHKSIPDNACRLKLLENYP